MNLDYGKTKRFGAMVVALSLWWLSLNFSVDGFGNNGNPDDAWIGWILAFSITVIQLIWNGMKNKTNLTLWVLGICAYLYGIFTNILGIWIWRGGTGVMSDFLSLEVIFPVILGLLLEIAPEPLFVWGLLGETDEGDFLGNLFGNQKLSQLPIGRENKKSGNSSYRPPTPTKTPYTNGMSGTNAGQMNYGKPVRPQSKMSGLLNEQDRTRR